MKMCVGGGEGGRAKIKSGMKMLGGGQESGMKMCVWGGGQAGIRHENVGGGGQESGMKYGGGGARWGRGDTGSRQAAGHHC